MSTHTPHPDQTVKVVHLVMALLFLGVVAAWALAATGALSPTALPYLAPALLVLAGLGGLGATARTARSRRASVTERAPAPERDEMPDDHPSDTMDAPPAPTMRLEEQHDPTHDGEPTAPLYRPEDHR